MKARVKDAWPWKSILALGGHEYIKGEFRPVPPERETEAEAHPYLDIKVEPVPVSTETPRPARKGGKR